MSAYRAAVAAAAILVFLGAQAAEAMSAPGNALVGESLRDGAAFSLAACVGPKCGGAAVHRPAGPSRPNWDARRVDRIGTPAGQAEYRTPAWQADSGTPDPAAR